MPVALFNPAAGPERDGLRLGGRVALTAGRRDAIIKFGANLVVTMLDIANDIRSLSDFKRNTSDLLDRLRKTGNPLVLTINGKAEVVVQDAEAYQELLERVETLEGIQRGLADVRAGRTKPARAVFERLRRKHGIPR
jgi:prevent-host-death family protein